MYVIVLVYSTKKLYRIVFLSFPLLSPFSLPLLSFHPQLVNSIVGVLRSRLMFVLLVTTLGSSLCYSSTQHSLSFC